MRDPSSEPTRSFFRVKLTKSLLQSIDKLYFNRRFFMSMVNLLNDANRAVEQARDLIQGNGKADAKALAKNLTVSREKLVQQSNDPLNDKQGEITKLLENIKTALKIRATRQVEEQVGGTQAVQLVLKALTELQKTVEKIKSDSEKQKRTITGTHESSL
jgi:hypothetical protein